MKSKPKAPILAAPIKLVLGCCLVFTQWSYGANQTQGSGQTAVGSSTRVVGTVKAVSGNIITLSTDTGASVSVTILDSTRMVRTAPGQKDLKDAVPIQLPEVQVGDRALARGAPSADGASVSATSLVVMKQADLTAKQERERDDWQKRGVGGLVSEVDAAARLVKLSGSGVGAGKPVAVRISKDTIIRRYLPDSVKFDDAKPSTLDEIKAGDQLRARGVRSADGTELTAEEVVSGSFRNIAGTVIAADTGNNTLSVMDLVTKKPVVVKITEDSQLRKLPPMVAQRIAMRLRGGNRNAGPGAAGPGPGSPAPTLGDSMPNSDGGGARVGGTPDFQQMLKRMPAVALADLQKGDALMIVTTPGTADTRPTAITLLSGVEPILSASPNGSRAAMLLSPWNLGGGGDAAAGP